MHKCITKPAQIVCNNTFTSFSVNLFVLYSKTYIQCFSLVKSVNFYLRLKNPSLCLRNNLLNLWFLY